MTQSRQPRLDEPNPAPAAEARTLLDLGLAAAQTYERPEFEARLRAAKDRLSRPDTVVCIAGAFKQGKSSLLNALVGERVCVVNDDLATTTVTVVRHAAERQAIVIRSRGGERIEELVAADAAARLASEQGNPGDRERIELVEIGLPAPILERGVTLVDTPGVGSLTRGHRAATLSFLPSADAVLFVSDASQELTAPELEFLRQAYEVCPTVLYVLTKTDLYPEWRRIAELDQEHLRAAGIPLEPTPASAVLRMAAIQLADAATNRDSGYPQLLEQLRRDVVQPAQTLATQNAVVTVRQIVGQMREAFERERAALSDPAHAERVANDLSTAQRRLEELRNSGARWQTTLSDGFSELNAGVEHELRGALRETTIRANEAIDSGDPGAEWPALAEQIQQEIAVAVEHAVTRVDETAEVLSEELAAILGEETAILAAPTLADASAIDPTEYWRERTVTTASLMQTAFGGLGVLRGAQGGIFMLAMMANFAGIALIGPALLGVGALFGGKAFVDQRRQQAAQRRQEARGFVRQHVDEVQFEVVALLRERTRRSQRALRDQCQEQLRSLQQDCQESFRSLQAHRQSDARSRAERIDLLASRVAKLDVVLQRADAIERALAAGVRQTVSSDEASG